MSSETILALSCNNSYVPYMAATIQSVLENSKSESKYFINILHGDISNDSQSLLEIQVSPYSNFRISFVNVKEYFSKYNLHYKGASIEAYYRLIIPYLFLDYSKVLYLDSDLICFTDIKELYDIDIGNCILGAVRGLPELGWYNSIEKHYWDTKLMLREPKNYFNSGVLLFNNQLFVDKISFHELLKICVKEKWPCFDQDVLNIVFQNDVFYLPYEWNYIKHPSSEFLDKDDLELYRKAEINPNIVHFAKGYKPWSNIQYMPFAYEFWKYALRTPFERIILNEMKLKNTCYNKVNRDVYDLPYLNLIKVIFERFYKKLKALFMINKL